MSEPAQIISVSDASFSDALEANLGTSPQPAAAFEPPRTAALPIPDAPFRQQEIIVPGYASSVLRRPIVRPMSPLEGTRACVPAAAVAPAALACGALGGDRGSGGGSRGGSQVSPLHAPPPAKRPRFHSASPCGAAGAGMGSEQESAEERRRRRVLNNRESAMRSLQKKADFAAKLEEEEREQRRVLFARRETLADTVRTAIVARKQIASGDGGNDALLLEVDDCIARCQEALAGEDAEETAAGVLNSGAAGLGSPAKVTGGVEGPGAGVCGDLSSLGRDESADVAVVAANARVEIEAAVEAGGD